MAVEDDVLVYDKLKYFGEDTNFSEIEKRGQVLYDQVRPLFDVSNSLVEVRYWGPDLESKSRRPAQRARVIRGVIVLTDDDTVNTVAFGHEAARRYFNTDTVRVFMMIFPEKATVGYIYPEDSIELRIDSKTPNGRSYGGNLQPNGRTTTNEFAFIPHSSHDQKINQVAEMTQETHDAFNLVAKAIAGQRLKPLTTSPGS